MTVAPVRSTGYRADIQGLRAIAVVAVVGYHLWPRAVAGGYAGVDVFFVISGFLITGQLTAEIERSGRVSLTRFWARRIRRLLPAAFTVLAAATGFLLLRMPTLERPENLAELRASAAYAENWLLGRHSVDYLARENSPSLVQHYWSLSVEEQFYLVWPLLLLLIVTITRRLGLGRRGQIALLALAGGASFVVSVVWTAREPSMAFFASPTRAWEFAVGALLALAPAGRTSTGRRVAQWAALTVLLVFLTAAPNGLHFPGWVAAIPVAAAAALIAGEPPVRGSEPLGWSRLPPVQWLGDASYSIYLWHWPLIIGSPWVLHHRLTLADDWLVLGLTLVLAAVTKALVEDPVRGSRALRSRRWPAFGFATTGAAAFVAVTAWSSPTPSTPPPAAVPAPIDRAADSAPAPGGGAPRVAATRRELQVRSCFGAAAMLPEDACLRPFHRPRGLDTAFAARDFGDRACLQNPDVTVPVFCRLGTKGRPLRTIVVVGNSHAWRLGPALDVYGRIHRWRVLLAAHVDCLGLASRPAGNVPPGSPCLRWSGALQRHLLGLRHLDGVIFVSHDSARKFLAGTNPTAAAVSDAGRQVLAAWNALTERGVRVFVTEDVPGLRPDNAPECIAMSAADDDPCSRPRSGLLHDNLLTNLAKAHPDLARYVPTDQYFCDAHRCHALVGGVIVYFDSHHLTDTYSRSLGPYLGAQIAAALPH